MEESTNKNPASQQTVWQAIKFILFSVSAGAIQFAAFALLENVLHLSYWVAYGIALILSVLWNFTFNRRYTFRSDMDVPRAMVLVFLFYLAFTPLSTWLGDKLVKGGINEYLVLIGTMVINLVTEYFYQRFVVYRKAIDTNKLAQNAGIKTPPEHIL